jgi:hypothetical protein
MNNRQEQQKKSKNIFDSMISLADINQDTENTQTDMQHTTHITLRGLTETCMPGSMTISDYEKNMELKKQKNPEAPFARQKISKSEGQSVQEPELNRFLKEIEGKDLLGLFDGIKPVPECVWAETPIASNTLIQRANSLMETSTDENNIRKKAPKRIK